MHQPSALISTYDKGHAVTGIKLIAADLAT